MFFFPFFLENFDFWALGTDSCTLNGPKTFGVLEGRHKCRNLSVIWHAYSLGKSLGVFFSIFLETFDFWALGTESWTLNGPKTFRVL